MHGDRKSSLELAKLSTRLNFLRCAPPSLLSVARLLVAHHLLREGYAPPCPHSLLTIGSGS